MDTFKANAASANSGAVPSGVTGGSFVNQNSPTGTIASSTTVATGTSTSAVTSAAKTGGAASVVVEQASVFMSMLLYMASLLL